jgi:hypothetical protein
MRPLAPIAAPGILHGCSPVSHEPTRRSRSPGHWAVLGSDLQAKTQDMRLTGQSGRTIAGCPEAVKVERNRGRRSDSGKGAWRTRPAARSRPSARLAVATIGTEPAALPPPPLSAARLHAHKLTRAPNPPAAAQAFAIASTNRMRQVCNSWGRGGPRTPVLRSPKSSSSSGFKIFFGSAIFSHCARPSGVMASLARPGGPVRSGRSWVPCTKGWPALTTVFGGGRRSPGAGGRRAAPAAHLW